MFKGRVFEYGRISKVLGGGNIRVGVLGMLGLDGDEVRV